MNAIIFILIEIIGIIIGGVVIGIFVGTNCAKTYNKKIDELKMENNQLYSELSKKKREEKEQALRRR